MAVLSPTTINQRVRIQGYKTKEGRNYFSADQLLKDEVVTSVHYFNQYWEAWKNQDPPLAFAFILLAWNHTLEHHGNGSLFSPIDAKNFLVDPMSFLKSISYPLNLVTRKPYNPFNRTKKWPD